MGETSFYNSSQRCKNHRNHMLYRRPIGSLLLALKKPQLRAFHQAIQDFDATQTAVLAQAMTQTRGSQFALAHGCGRAPPTLDAFPICDYEGLRPWIERFARGDSTALFGPASGITPQRCKFVTTSGTTGLPKLIPVTPASFAVQAASWQAWGLSAFEAHRDAAFLDVLPISSPAQGSMSGLATWAMQSPSFKTLYAVPDQAQGITPFELKLKALLRLTVGNPNIGMLMTANPSTLLMLVQQLEAYGFDLVRDLRQGSFFAGDPAQLGVPALGRRDAAAAKRLDRILTQRGRLTPIDVWPRLKLIAMWLGGTLSHYSEALRPTLGHVPWRDHGLVASEGRFTVPLGDGSPDGVLDPRVAYYEFLPVESASPEFGAERRDPIAQTRQLIRGRDMIPGQNYHLFVTTLGGLFRYDMHDIVECRGHFGGRPGTAPIVRFLRKSSQFSNITGEKLSAFQVAEALTELGDECCDTMRTSHFTTLAPNRDEYPPHYVLYAESTRQIRSEWDTVARALDERLSSLNCEYREKRASGRLGTVQIAFLRPGSLEHLRTHHLNRTPGATAEQFKQPVLWNDLTSPLRDMAFEV